jgi:hypothetical protein
VGTALKGAPVTYAIGPKQHLAVQAGGRYLHPVKYDNFQDSSYLFVICVELIVSKIVRGLISSLYLNTTFTVFAACPSPEITMFACPAPASEFGKGPILIWSSP